MPLFPYNLKHDPHHTLDGMLVELFTFTNGLLIRASIRAFLIVEFTHVMTAFDATVLMVLSLSLLVFDGV
jgi:hypothetical protein